MGQITTANLKTLTDKLAKIRTLLNAALGDGSAATMASEHAKDNRDTVRDIGDEVQVLDMLQAYQDTYEKLLTLASAHGLVKPSIIALERHLTSGLNAATNVGTTWRYAQEFALLARKLQVSLDAAKVFPVPLDDSVELGTYAVSGSGTGVFTDGSAVDTDLYGPYGDRAGAAVTDALELEVINQQIQGENIVVTTTYVNQDGDTVVCAATSQINSASAVGTKVDIELDAGDWGATDVSAITITGGTNGDDFRIQGKRERALGT